MLGLHGGAFAIASLWLAKQHNNWSWQRKPRGQAA